MAQTDLTHIETRLRRAVAATACVALIVGLATVIAWTTGLMQHWALSGAITIKTNMGIGQCCAGLALLMLGLKSARGWRRLIGLHAAAIALLLGALTLAEHVFRTDFGIDQLFATEPPGAAATASSNRMGVPGSTSLTLLGAALLLMGFRRFGPVPYLGLATLLVNIVPAVGFILGVPELYAGKELTGVAWPTVLVMMMLGAALVLTRANRGPLELLLRDDAGGRLMRDLLPVGVLLPTALGVLRMTAQQFNLMDDAVGRALFAVAMTVLLVLLLWRSAARLSATDQRQRAATSALRDSEDFFHALASNAPAAIFIKDLDGRYRYANPVTCATVGRPGGIVGLRDSDFLPPDVAAAVRAHDLQVSERGGTMECEEVIGERCFLSVKFPLMNGSAKAAAVCGVAVDITERKAMERALQDAKTSLEDRVRDRTRELAAANAKFQAMYTQGSLAAVLALDGTVLDVNNTLVSACGYKREDMLERPLWETNCWGRIPEAQAWLKTGLAEAAAGRTFRGETVYAHADGSEHFVDLAFIPIKEEDTRVLFVVATGLDITDRKRAEAELKAADVRRESEAQFRQLADSAPVMIRMTDSRAGCTFLSRSWGEFTGQTADEGLGLGWMDAIHAQDRPAVRDMLARCAERGEPFRIEYRLKRQDGAHRWVMDAGAPRFRPDGKTLQGYIGSIIDVTDRRLAELRRREAATLLEGSLDALTNHIAILDSHGTIIKVNDAWRRLAEQNGNGAAFGVGANYLRACESSAGGSACADEGPRAAQGIREVMAGETPVFSLEYACRGPSPPRWFVMRVTRFGEDDTLHVVVSHEDITPRRLAEQSIRDSEEKFRDLADNMSQSAWMADGTGWVFWYNKRWLDYTGAALEDALGWGWRALHHPDHVDRVVASIRRSWATGEPWEETFPLRGHDGQYRWFLSRAVPIRDAAGRIIRWFGTDTDITDQRSAEAELQKAKEAAEASSQAKDRFLAVLSHELRTPLTPVLMTVSAMEQDLSLPEAARTDLGMIRRNVELEAKLIDDLLDLSRIANGKLTLRPEPVLLNEAIRHVCEICRSQVLLKQLTLNCALDERVIRVQADPARLQQVLWNLLKNAIKFTPERGTITIRSMLRDDGLAQIEVSDTGVGIDADSLPRIFDAFEQGDPRITRQFGGLGLGLAISRAIAELHRGSLRASSPGLGNGATFILELPLAAANGPTPSNFPSDDPAERQPGLDILVVEDHADTARVLSRFLGALGHTVRTAHNVQEALAAARDADFDLVLSDIGLPDATGYDLMRSLRERGAVVGIAMSGYGTDDDIRRSHEAGFAEHIIKPVQLSQLESALRRLGRGPRQQLPDANETPTPPPATALAESEP